MTPPAPPRLTVGQIAERVGGELIGPADRSVTGMQTLELAGETELTYIGDERYAKGWASSKAGAALIRRGLELAPGDGRALIVVDDVDLATVSVLEAFAPPPPRPEAGVHPSAVVDATAQIGEGARIGPLCVVGPGAAIGDGAILHASVTVMTDSRIGPSTELWPGVVVRERCSIGPNTIIHPNATIGSDGFGYRPAPDGRGLTKVPQIGTVEVGAGVEIGSATCVDRGKFGPTVIGDGTKIDNLVQIAHNCRIGRCVIIAGCTGIAGSVTIGDGAIFGGTVSVRDHLTIGAGATLLARSAVMKDVPAGETWAGVPAKEVKIAAREYAAIQRLPDLIKRMRRG